MQTEVIRDLDPLKIGRLVDRKALFLQHWRFRRHDADAGEWNRRIAVELEPMFAARLAQACRDGVFEPAAVIGVAPTWSAGDNLILLDGIDRAAPPVEISFARRPDGRCVADLFPPVQTLSSPAAVPADPVRTGWFVATLGPKVAVFEASLKDGGNFEEYHLFHGLAAAMVEALAEEIHGRAAAMLAGTAAVSDGASRGIRLSPGYPCCPDLSMQVRILAMLGADRIGVTLSETFQMVPELTVSALVTGASHGEKYL